MSFRAKQDRELFHPIMVGGRQLHGAKTVLAENGGGIVRAEPAAISVHILSS